MPRKNLIRSNILPYHIVNRSNHRMWFPIPMQDAWSEFQLICSETSLMYGAQFHAAVLMSNHFHIVLSTPEMDLGAVTRLLIGKFAKTINRESKKSGHVFSGRHKWTLIEHPAHYMHTIKYVYRNPVKANLVKRVEDYPYSSLHGLMGESHLLLPIVPTLAKFDNQESIIFSETGMNWLNTPTPNEEYLAIQTALRRPCFTMPNARNNRKKIILADWPSL